MIEGGDDDDHDDDELDFAAFANWQVGFGIGNDVITLWLTIN